MEICDSKSASEFVDSYVVWVDVYGVVSGHKFLQRYSSYLEIWSLPYVVSGLPELEPVETLAQFKRI